jgi:hypothetical protein
MPSRTSAIGRVSGKRNAYILSRGIVIVLLLGFLFFGFASAGPQDVRTAREAAAHHSSGAAGISAQTSQATRNPEALDLDALLKKTAAYCQKLESSILDFVCLEEIRETIDPTHAVVQSDNNDSVNDWGWVLGNWMTASRRPQKIKSSYLYDY